MELKPFIELLRRAAKSKFKDVLMNNRMLLQCYSIEEDGSIGMHYVLFIPDSYQDDFYDRTIYLDIKDIMSIYKTGHDILSDYKKEHKLKTKDCREEFSFHMNDKNEEELIFHFIAEDKIIYVMKYPLNDHVQQKIERIISTYQSMLDRVRVGGFAATFDGIRYYMYERASNTPDIDYYKIKINGEKIKLPLFKSLLAGINNPDQFLVSIVETVYPGIYQYTIQLSNKGITDQYIGYIQNF